MKKVETKPKAPTKGVKNVKQRLSEAREIISKTPIKKSGRNKFSNYDYFTPSQVTSLVDSACHEVGLLPMFSLQKNELGYVGILIVASVDTDEQLNFSLVTDVPQIKATNEAQKLGGMMTYTKRYLEMSTFGITDNNLDFDTQDNRPKKTAPKPALKAMTAEIAKTMLGFIADDKAHLVRTKLPLYAASKHKEDVVAALRGK